MTDASETDASETDASETDASEHSKAFTPPKGRPTPRRDSQAIARSRSQRSVTLQWLAFAVILTVVVVTIAVVTLGDGGTAPTHGGF